MFKYLAGALAAWLFLPVAAAGPWDALRAGGVLIVMRHAETEAGTGDPPGFRLDDCRTQRNLSPSGRLQARRFGEQLAARGVRPAAVFSSEWCRCLDTAAEAFPGSPIIRFRALNSLFNDASRKTAQGAEMRAALARIPAGGVTVWVTHQFNIIELAGESLAMGEALVLKAEAGGGVGKLGRLPPPPI